jgi:FkbM family methyltransferase
MILPFKIRKYFRSIYARLNQSQYHQWKKRKMRKFYSQFLKAGDLCFDIGAHEGKYAEVFVGLCGNVVAVEPVDENLLHLKKKFHQNQKVIILPLAVDYTDGESKVNVACHTELSTLSSKFVQFHKNRFPELWTATRVVQLITLHQLITQFGVPRFCKIDVEGYESRVLQTLNQPIDFISYEFLYDFREDAIECAGLLNQLGNASFNYTLFEFFELELSRWIKYDAFVEHIRKLHPTHLTGDIFVKF